MEESGGKQKSNKKAKEEKIPVKNGSKKVAANVTVEKEAVKEVKPVTSKAVKIEEPKGVNTTPRKSVVFIGSECYPFVKTGGPGDVMELSLN